MEFASNRNQSSIDSQTDEPILVENPEIADLAIFPIDGGAYGPCFEKLRANKLYQHVYYRSVVYSTNDQQYPAVPGIYCGIPKRWCRPGWAMTSHYLSVHTQILNFSRSQLESKDILYSFVGSSRTHTIRQRLVEMSHPQGVIIDSTPASDPRRWWEKGDKQIAEQAYRDVILRSKFVLCPRGVSPLSYRLFDAMSAAAVPVILADDVELPHGPDWSRCSITIKQADLEDLPARIESIQYRASEMGSFARDAWERYFSPSSSLRYITSLAKQVAPSSQSMGSRCFMQLRARSGEFLEMRVLRKKIKYAFFEKSK